MNITITPTLLCGTVNAIPSKSQAHRLLICAAFADKPTTLICPETNQDIDATVSCLNALGAHICRTENGYKISPILHVPQSAVLHCGESGSTLRFMLPVAAALGVDTTFVLEGRLPQRPMSPLWEELERMGCQLTRPETNAIRCTGKLQCGKYEMSGKVSSQFITGLLFAMSIMDGVSTLEITDELESKPYVDMTKDALKTFSVCTNDNKIHGSVPLSSPGCIHVEGDWSNAAFFLTASAIGNNVNTTGLNKDSKQGDKAVSLILDQLKNNAVIDCKDIPDLVPILSVAAAAHKGAIFTNIQRLRLKESDRVEAVLNMLHAFGINAFAEENALHVQPGKFHSCTVDSCNDHRIAMATAIAATIATGPVTILNGQCVSKSYPKFWQDYRTLGGKYE